MVIALGLHLFAISFPRDAKVFDEAYYVPAALDLINLKVSNIEHPFLGKAWIALGILLFGDNWFGWRIISVIFGTLTLFVFYKLTLRFLPKTLAAYATLLLAFENMFFVHSSLALLETSSIFFAILGFYLYFSKKYYWTAISLGLSALSKETGVLFLLTIIIYHLIATRRIPLTLRNTAKSIIFLTLAVSTVLIPMTVYDITYNPQATSVIVQAKIIDFTAPDGTVTSRTTTTETMSRNTPISNAIEHMIQIIVYSSSLTINNQSTVNSGNYAWNWFIPLPDSLPPTVYYAISVNKTITERTDGVEKIRSVITQPIAWFGVGNMPIWWATWLIITASGYMIARKRAGEAEHFILIWLACNYLPMLYLSLAVHRIVYPFYFLNSVPALALGMPYAVKIVLYGERKLLAFALVVYMAIVLVFFAYYYPVRILEQ